MLQSDQEAGVLAAQRQRRVDPAAMGAGSASDKLTENHNFTSGPT